MRRAKILAVALMLALVPTATLAQDHVIDESRAPSFLSVVSASSGSVDGDTLSLYGVPSVVYFSDRPARIAGVTSIETLAGSWTLGPDPFATDPPNAVLSMLGAELPNDVVVELTSLELVDDSLRFGIKVIEGELPQGELGSASLFIDDFGPCPGC